MITKVSKTAFQVMQQAKSSGWAAMCSIVGGQQCDV
jgi:hypothetical protein